MDELIYLDFNASTPLAPEVLGAMMPFLVDRYGNPSGAHWAAREARRAIEAARGQVAHLLGAVAEEIVFTSGGSEANNFALKGVFFRSPPPVHFVSTAVEHPAILAPLRFLESLEARVTIVPVDGTGRVDPDDVRRAIGPRTRLVSVMHANNEVGTVQPIAEIAQITRQHGVLLHTDAAQSVGKIPTLVDELGVDLLSIAGHKMYAPKGVGALYVRRGVAIEPLVHGAGHEGGRRAGTENTPYLVALGAACSLAGRWIGERTIQDLRDHFWARLHDALGGQVVLNGHPSHRLPNTLNLGFRGRVGRELLEAMPSMAASTGSACHAGSIELSPVLAAMGVAVEIGMGAIRFSLGRTTTRAQIDAVVDQLLRIVR